VFRHRDDVDDQGAHAGRMNEKIAGDDDGAATDAVAISIALLPSVIGKCGQLS
jgi:hypothetical protein